MLLSKQDTEFFIDMGCLIIIITEITSKNSSNSSPKYCNGYNDAINRFILYFKKQYTPVIRYRITKLMRRLRKRELRYFVNKTSPYKWSKVDNHTLSDAMCTVLCLVYSDMRALDVSKCYEYYEGYHKAVIDIAVYCGLREVEFE